MKKIPKYFSVSMIVIFLLLSCEVGKFDSQESPNYLTYLLERMTSCDTKP